MASNDHNIPHHGGGGGPASPRPQSIFAGPSYHEDVCSYFHNDQEEELHREANHNTDRLDSGTDDYYEEYEDYEEEMSDEASEEEEEYEYEDDDNQSILSERLSSNNERAPVETSKTTKSKALKLIELPIDVLKEIVKEVC